MNSCFSPLTTPLQASVASVTNYSELQIRTACLKDLSSLATVLAESFHPPEGWMSLVYPVLKLGIYEDLRSRFNSASDNYLCLVASVPSSDINKNKEEAVATVEMALRSHSFPLEEPRYPYISNLAVRKAHRRKGIAYKLLVSCEHQAREWGFSELYLHVLDNNEQAKQLYFNRGYQVCRIEPNYSPWLFKNPRRLFLRKYLLATRNISS